MSMRRRSVGTLGCAAAVLGALASDVAASPNDAPPRTLAATSVRGRTAVGAATALLRSDSLEDRLRGLERLGETGTPRAVGLLVRALQPGGSAATPEERLTAVRALSTHASEPSVRRALVRVLGGHALPATTATAAPLDDLAESVAALALARTGDAGALEALGRALDTPGRTAEIATTALVAHPPRHLSAVLAAARSTSLALAGALDALADQHGFERLRTLVRLGTPEVRARAALALTRLGDYETVALARRWIAPGQPGDLRVAGAAILATASDAGAAAAVASLIADPRNVDDGVRLALVAPHPALVKPLERLLGEADDDRAADVIAALGRIGDAGAVAVLEATLGHPRRGALAAHALARTPGDAAASVLSRALRRAPLVRLAARAAGLRALLLDETLPELPAALLGLAASKAPEDRATAAAVTAALSPSRLPALLDSADRAVVAGAASALLLAPPGVAEDAASRLARARGSTRTALALSLAVPGAEDRVPTRVLAAIAAAGDAASPLAARALTARDDPRLRDDTRALLESADPWIRSNAALGLGRSREPDATGMLEAAYRFETDAAVREAIIRALGRRPSGAQTRTIALAASLDPSDAVRGLARRARAGSALPEAWSGTGVAWVPVAHAGGSDGPATISVRVPGGLVLPAASQSDGTSVIAGLPQGPVELRVAPADEPDDAP